MKEDHITLTHNERIILSNQYQILEALYPKQAADFREKRIIVESGYELHYDELDPSILENTFPAENCREVMDILDMFRVLNYSYTKLENKDGINIRHLRFVGFDGNDSSGNLFYARFLILTQKRWTEILEEQPGFDLNSHMPVNEMYRRMLDEWHKSANKYDLTRDDIIRILDARIHPERR